MPVSCFSFWRVISAAHLFALLSRARWIILSMLLIYALATPGDAVWASLVQFSPTHPGLTSGMLLLFKLIFTLAGLAILLGLLSRHQFVSGMYIMLYPFRYVGLPYARLAVRLALILQYAESAIMDTTVNWRSRIYQLIAPVEVNSYSIDLHILPLSIRAGVLLMTGSILLVLVSR